MDASLRREVSCRHGEPHAFDEGGAYINLLCAMWRSDDGTLPNDDTKLARSGRSWSPALVADVVCHPNICSTLTATGSPTPTFKPSLGKANALLVTRRAVGRLGGQATQFKRAFRESHLRENADGT